MKNFCSDVWRRSRAKDSGMRVGAFYAYGCFFILVKVAEKLSAQLRYFQMAFHENFKDECQISKHTYPEAI